MESEAKNEALKLIAGVIEILKTHEVWSHDDMIDILQQAIDKLAS
jgi:hypothetical protein